MKRVLDWLQDRTGYRDAIKVALEEPVLGGASFAYVFGSVLTFILVLQMVTGVFLAMYYSPSATDAWGSVAYIQDQVTMGWFVRGLHSHGASAMVVVAAMHLFQTALWGAYKAPREVNWILGVLMFGLILAFALTGYLLPWDQTGYWATKVATGIAGTTPVVGAAMQEAIQGGNEYGNLTLTRFFAIHVFILPAGLIALTLLHIAVFRRHGQTPHWRHSDEELRRRVQPFWPDQLFRDMCAIAIVFGALVAITLYTRGASLDAPADPSSAFDARPEWYFRPLFQALKYFEGTMEQVVALGLPVVVGGVLLLLPRIDRNPSRSPLKRLVPLTLLFVMAFAAAGLTYVSFAEDAADPRVQEALADADKDAERARELARQHGVPEAGGPAVFDVAKTVDPMAEAKEIWKRDCVGCHDGKEREAPLITRGYNSRDWIRRFLLDPSGDEFYGRTKIDGMEPVELKGADLDAAVELVYSQTGAPDVNKTLAETGRAKFANEWDCNNCHELEWDSSGQAPTLARRGSVDMLTEFIGNAAHPRWFGDANQMPLFYDEYNRVQRREVAEYLVWLRTARGDQGDQR